MGRVARRAIPDCMFSLQAIQLSNITEFLQRYWDFAATEPPDQQRLRLIRHFIDLDEYPANGILRRTATTHAHGGGDQHGPPSLAIGQTAQKAWQILASGNATPIFLRTHYNAEDDEKMEEWVGASEEFENQAWWACLNDVTLSDFGSDWQRVCIMPEVAGPVSGAGYKRYPSSEIVEMSRAQFKSPLSKTKQSEPDRWREDPHRFIELEAADLLRTVAAAYILVADQEAFETGGQLRLIYVNDK